MVKLLLGEVTVKIPILLITTRKGRLPRGRWPLAGAAFGEPVRPALSPTTFIFFPVKTRTGKGDKSPSEKNQLKVTREDEE